MGGSTRFSPRDAGAAPAIGRGVAVWLVAAALVPPSVGSGAAPAAPTLTVTWTGLPLHTVCERLSTLLGRPVILDRRVDPGIPLSLDLRDTAADEALVRICDAAGAGCAVLANSIRIVPAGLSARVVAAEEARGAALKKLPERTRKAAAATAPSTWSDGVTPRGLLVDLAREGGLAIDGLDDLPHDHLRGAALPTLPLAERIDLLLLQYDRRLDWSGARQAGGKLRVSIVPCDDAGAEGPAVAAAAGAWESFARGSPPPPRRRRRPGRSRSRRRSIGSSPPSPTNWDYGSNWTPTGCGGGAWRRAGSSVWR